MRNIKFRVWDKYKMYYPTSVTIWNKSGEFNFGEGKTMHYKAEEYCKLMQYTGLKDKNGKEIYEFMELDGRWEVNWLNGKYILRDISSGDIIGLNYENKYEITKEYTKV